MLTNIELLLEKRREYILILSYQHTLVFFHESGTLASRAFAYVAIEFSKKYRWDLMPLCVDFGSLPCFDVIYRDVKMAQKYDIEILPSLAVIDFENQKRIAISSGLTSLDELEHNIAFHSSF